MHRGRPTCRIRNVGTAVLATLALISLATAVNAATLPNLVQNGSFAVTGGNGSSFQFGSGCGTNCTGYGTVASWATSGYNFVYLPGTADTTGGEGVSGNVKLWGPNDGAANGLPASAPAAFGYAAGGNYIAADGAYEVEPITQTITGLKVGQAIAVSFVWAAAQQYSFNGPTSDFWTVDLGSSPVQTTNTVSLVSNGFSGWMTTTMYFVATSSTEVLSFLATGTPSGQPPFALLADVSVTNAPEPAGLMIFLSGLAALALVVQRRRQANRELPAH